MSDLGNSPIEKPVASTSQGRNSLDVTRSTLNSQGDQSLKRRKAFLKTQNDLLRAEYSRQIKFVSAYVADFDLDQQETILGAYDGFYNTLSIHSNDITQIDSLQESRISALENEQKTLRESFSRTRRMMERRGAKF